MLELFYLDPLTVISDIDHHFLPDGKKMKVIFHNGLIKYYITPKGLIYSTYYRIINPGASISMITTVMFIFIINKFKY